MTLGLAAAETAKLPRYADKGIAIDCLSQPMKAPFPKYYSYSDIRGGTITCPENCANVPDKEACFSKGRLLAAILVVLHASLVLIPIISIPILYNKYRNQTRARSFGMVLAAMGALSLSSLGEVSEHMHDNWLYTGLIPSYHNAVFHGALALGQAFLAWGVAGWSSMTAIDLCVVVINFGALTIGATLYADAPLTDSSFPFVYKLVFTGLGVVTAHYMYRSFTNFGGFHVAANWRFAAGIIITFGAGIYCALQIETTGDQQWHKFTAGSFILLYLFQLFWLAFGMSMKESTD